MQEVPVVTEVTGGENTVRPNLMLGVSLKRQTLFTHTEMCPMITRPFFPNAKQACELYLIHPALIPLPVNAMNPQNK